MYEQQLQLDLDADALESNPASTDASQRVLDKEAIFVMYDEALAHCTALYPVEHWAHHPVGMELDHARRRIGCAYADGVIKITKHFIGTSETEFLWDTLVHEMAHLAAGIPQKHGPVWQKVATHFGCDTKATAKMPPALAENTRARWELWAIMFDGQELLLRRCHRRSKQYQKARPGAYLVDGKRVKYFEYRDAGAA